MGAALQRDAPPPPPSHAPSRHAWSRIQDVDFVDDNDHVDDDAVWWSGDRRVLVEEIADWPRSCPVLHLNIQEDFPLDKQRAFVRSAYRFWLYTWWVSVINFVAVMATLLTSNVTNPSTMVLSFMLSAVYLFAVFFLWFRPLYWAVRLESSVLFFWFYLFSVLIMAFFFYMITQALGLVSILASPLAPGSNLPVKVNPIFPTVLFTLVVLFYLFGVLLVVYYISTAVWWHRMTDREKMLLYKKQKRSGWLAPWYGGSVVAEADLDDVDDDGSKPKYSYATILSFEKTFDDTVDGSGPLHEDPSEVYGSGGAAAKSSRRGKSKSRGSVHDTLTLPGSLGIYPNTRKIIFKSQEAIFNNLFKMTVLFLNITSLRTEGELLLVITEKLNSGVPRDERRKFNEDTPTCVLPGEDEGPRVRELRLDFDTLANRDECHRQLEQLWRAIKKKENLYVAEDEAELKSMRTRLAARTRERAAQHLLTHKDWNLLVSYVWRREYQAGEIILDKGETFNEVQHVTQGVVDIYLETTEGARSKQEKKEMDLTRESLGMGEDLDLQALLFPVTEHRISQPAPDLQSLEGQMQSRAVPRYFKVRFPKRNLGLSYCKTKRGYNLDEYTRHEATPKRTYPDNLAAIVHAVKRNGDAARLGVRPGDELVRVELYDVEANGLSQRAITSLIKGSQFPLNLEFRRPPEVEFDEDDRGFLEPNQHLVPEEARNNLSGYERAAIEGRATREPLVSVRLDSPAGELDEEEAAALLARTYRDGDSTSEEEGGGSDADELEHDVEGALLPQPNVPNVLKGSSSSKAAAVAPFPSPASPPATPPLSRRPSAGGAFFGRPYSAAAGMGRSPSPAARSSSFRSRGSDLIELRSLHSGEAAADEENYGGAANGAQHSLDLAEQYAEQVAAESAESARRQEQQKDQQQRRRQQQQQQLLLQQLQPPGSGSQPRSPSRGGSPQPLTQFKQLGRTYASYAVRPAETIEFDANAPTVKDLEMQELGHEAAQPASMARRYSMVRRLLSQGTQYLFGARFRYNRVEDVGTLRPQVEPEHRFSFAGGSYAGSRRGSLGGPGDGLRDDISIVVDRAGARGAGAPPPGDGDSSDDESVGDYFYGLRVFEPVGTFERGDTIGVVPWILNQPVSVSQLRAKTDVVIHAISVADLTALFRKNGTLALAFFKYVAAVIGERADRDEEVLCDQIEEQMRRRDQGEEQAQALTRLLDSKPIRSTQSTMFQQRVFEMQKARKWFQTDFDMAFDSIIFSEPCTMTIVGDIKVLIGRSWYGVDTRSQVEYMQPKEGVLYVTKYYVCFRTTKRALDITKLKRRPTLYGKVHLNDIYEVRRLGSDAEQVTLLTDELRLDISFPSPGKSELVEDWINALLNAGTMVERAPHSYTLPGDLHGLSSGTADAKLPLSVASDPMNVCFAKQHDLRTEFLVLTQTLQQVLTKQDRFKMFHDGSSVTLKRGQNVLTASRFASDMRADEDSGADPARARRTTTAPQAMKVDGPNGLYLLGAGELIVQREVNGRRVQFACYKVGTVFGVERFLTGAPSPFTVKVSSERAMLKFAPRDRCMALLKADLSLAARFYQYCALLQLQRLRGPLLSKPQEEPWEQQVAKPSRGTQGCSIL